MLEIHALLRLFYLGMTNHNECDSAMKWSICIMINEEKIIVIS